MSDFFSEIEEAYNQHLLEAGNLNQPRKQVAWAGFDWEPKGYSARLETYSCACGNVTENLLGIFFSETRKRADGGLDRREKAVDRSKPFSSPGEHAVHVSYLPSVQFCAACLPSKGFTNYRSE